MEKKFLLKLLEGGQIVSSNDCHEIEIAEAQAHGKFLVIDSFGFVYRTKEQTEKIQATFAQLKEMRADHV